MLNDENMWTQVEKHHSGSSWWGGGYGRNSGVWGWIIWGEMLDIVKGGIEVANQLVIYAPMQQPLMTCTCTPESKVK